MKRLLLGAMVAISFSLSGCGTSASPVDTVSNMIGDLYFKQGDYASYQSCFLDPSHVASQTQFNNIRNSGSKTIFPNAKTVQDVTRQLRTFSKDDKTAEVYWVDFSLNKSQDLHWNLTKTDNGWKIIN